MTAYARPDLDQVQRQGRAIRQPTIFTHNGEAAQAVAGHVQGIGKRTSLSMIPLISSLIASIDLSIPKTPCTIKSGELSISSSFFIGQLK